MASHGKLLRLMRNLDELANHLLSYVCDTQNRIKIISMLEDAYSAFNTYTHRWKSYYDSYYSARFADIPSTINELKKINRYAEENPNTNVEFINRSWLIEVVKFLYDDRWDKETRPSVIFLRAILKEFTLYEQKHAFPLGLAMETLFQSFYEQACTQANEYVASEEQKQALRRTLKLIRHKEPVVIPEVKKSYQAPERKQIDFENNGEFKKVKNSLEEIFKAKQLHDEQPKQKLGKKPKVKIQTAKDNKKFQGSLFDELMQAKKFRAMKCAAEPETNDDQISPPPAPMR